MPRRAARPPTAVRTPPARLPSRPVPPTHAATVPPRPKATAGNPNRPAAASGSLSGRPQGTPGKPAATPATRDVAVIAKLPGGHEPRRPDAGSYIHRVIGAHLSKAHTPADLRGLE